jgi:hypothetical protein
MYRSELINQPLIVCPYQSNARTRSKSVQIMLVYRLFASISDESDCAELAEYEILPVQNYVWSHFVMFTVKLTSL